ncbi:DUF6777 domain-containing protein [Streptomyces sp. NPDC048650]|uniref:DUF6777 domain-containing protein n=1 Tax=unclassified Streptomyces TaxID=2593676 RepID=UPI00371601FA
MTSQPPPDSSPTGPPSGPLSGPSSGTPSGPATEPTRAGAPPTEVDRPQGPGGGAGGGSGGGGGGGGGGKAGGGGDGRPWWRSAPRVAIVAAAVVAAVVLTVVLTRPGGTGAGEVFLQPAADKGPDPFTRSTAKQSSLPPSPSSSPGTPTGAPSGKSSAGTPTYQGSTPGLYGGSRSTTSCNVERQITYLESDRARAKAFAATEGVDVGAVPSFLRSLTPVQLRRDTRVTNHGFKDGKATAFQSVLQTGSAVLVDSRGMPRVRCACGNPLRPPVAVSSNAKTVGKAWPGYRASNTVAVQPSSTDVHAFVLYDPETGQYFQRPKGSAGSSDSWTPPPTTSPSGTPPTTPPSSGPSSSSSGTSGSSGPQSSAPTSAPPGSSSAPPQPESPTQAPTTQAPTSASQPATASTGGESGQVSP